MDDALAVINTDCIGKAKAPPELLDCRKGILFAWELAEAPEMRAHGSGSVLRI